MYIVHIAKWKDCFFFNTGEVKVSESIILSVDSNLNGASPQFKFTLTCISTGGPATTVTWTRDSTTLTRGTKTVLNDLVSRAVAIGAAGAAIAAPILRIPELILPGLPLYNSAASNLFRARGGVAPFMQSIE